MLPYAIVADDEPANRDFIVRLIQMAGFRVEGAGTGAEAIAAAAAAPEGSLTLAIIDHQLPDATGLEVIRAIRPAHPNALIIMATMHDHRELIDQAFEQGIDVFLVKPHGFMELFRRLQEGGGGNVDTLRRLVIDQYGPRPYKGQRKTP